MRDRSLSLAFDSLGTTAGLVLDLLVGLRSRGLQLRYSPFFLAVDL